MNWRLFSFLAGIGIFALVSSLTGARADEQGVEATKLILTDDSANGGSKLLSLKLAGPGIHKGADGDPALVSGSVEIFYMNGTTMGALPMPAPWAKNARGQAKFVNRNAPAGGSAVQSASFSTGKKAKVVAVDLGGLDLSAPPDELGVLVVVTLQNDNDGAEATHKMCTKFSVDEGSTIQHSNRNGKRSLVMTHGAEASCDPPCGNRTFTFPISSIKFAFIGELWPDGTVTQCSSDGCCVQVLLPEGHVDGVQGLGPEQFLCPFDPSGFFIYTFSGFSNCQAETCTNTCGGLSERSCVCNRPYCPFETSSVATYTVHCEN
ncbi:MAG: hypothetical protein HYZ50_27120 [Deltaproteobacteria bacterium]|nr:hypothetical protein [Deltaproteobacteria bacterium]